MSEGSQAGVILASAMAVEAATPLARPVMARAGLHRK